MSSNPGEPEPVPGEMDEEPWETCAFSGERRPVSDMLPYGEHFVLPEHKDAFVRLLETGERVASGRGFLDEPLDGGIGTVFRQGFALLKRSPLPLAIFLVIFWLPLDLIDSFVSWHFVDWGYDDVANPIFNEGQFQIVSTMMHTCAGLAGVIYFYAALQRTWEGRPPDIGDDCLVVLRRFFPALAARLMATALMLFGFLFLIIPGFFFAVRLCVVDAVASLERRSSFSAVQRGFHLTRDRFGLAFVFGLLVNFAFNAVPGFLLNLAWEWLPIESWVLAGFLSWCFTLPSALAVLFLFVLYRHLIDLGKNPPANETKESR